MASGSASTKKKRKRVVLTIEEKVKVLDMLDKSVSYSIIAEKFGIGKSTVSDLKKKQGENSRFPERNDGHGNEEASKNDEVR